MKTTHQRIGALVLAAAVSAALLCPPALAAGALSPVCDESYYATLDYYGGLINSSVVKSYQTNGNTELTDYGTYDEIINLTDDRAPTTQGRSVSTSRGKRSSLSGICPGPSRSPISSTALPLWLKIWPARPAWWRSIWTCCPIPPPLHTAGTIWS